MIVSTPWETLRTLPAWQLTQVPRRPADDDGAPQRFQALAAAYCRAAPVALAWLREDPEGPVRLLAAGPALAGGRDREQTVLTVPAGARGSPLAPDAAAIALLGLPYWTALSGISDALLSEDNESVGDPPSLEDGLLSAWSEPFGWLLLAEPVTRDVLDELTSTAASAQLSAQQTSSLALSWPCAGRRPATVSCAAPPPPACGACTC